MKYARTLVLISILPLLVSMPWQHSGGSNGGWGGDGRSWGGGGGGFRR